MVTVWTRRRREPENEEDVTERDAVTHEDPKRAGMRRVKKGSVWSSFI